jgi:hypothetical protein
MIIPYELKTATDIDSQSVTAVVLFTKVTTLAADVDVGAEAVPLLNPALPLKGKEFAAEDLIA